MRLILLFIFFNSIQLMANIIPATTEGTPLQDKEVAKIRDIFEKGSFTPSKEQLNLSNYLKCKEYMAQKNDFNVYDRFDSFKFVDIGLDDYVANIGEIKVNLFHILNEGLAGALETNEQGYNMSYLIYFRLDGEQRLIGELALSKKSHSRLPSDLKKTMATSLISDLYLAKSYFVCATH